MIAVIALKKRHYDDFIKHWVDREDHGKFFLVQEQRHLIGRKITEVIRIGNYYDLPNFKRIYDYAKHIKERGK